MKTTIKMLLNDIKVKNKELWNKSDNPEDKLNHEAINSTVEMLGRMIDCLELKNSKRRI